MPEIFAELRLQAADHVAGVDLALRQRLQIDLNAAAVQRGVGAVDADERRQALDRRVLQDHLATLCCRRDISLNETDCAASVTPWITPVS